MKLLSGPGHRRGSVYDCVVQMVSTANNAIGLRTEIDRDLRAVVFDRLYLHLRGVERATLRFASGICA